MNVSVVIPNYNGEPYIIHCIACIYDQVNHKRSIIVIDNASEDQSVSLIKQKYPDITILENETNLGFATAVNQGLRHADTAFVILLNNDAFAKPKFVEHLYNCILSDDTIFSVSAKILRFSNPNVIDDAGDFLTLMGWAIKSGDGELSYTHNKERVIFSACAGAAIYRKEILQKIGHFDDLFFAYLEDVDLGYRANNRGYKNIYCPSAEVLHIGSATSGSRHNAFKVRLTARNTFFVLMKNMPAVFILLNSPFIVLGFVIKALYFWRIGLGKHYYKGLLEGARTVQSVKRSEFRISHSLHYLRSEFLMVKSTLHLTAKIFLDFFKVLTKMSRPN